ncbi:MAG TPA: hypothetical protein VFL36_15220 [Myxococcales bacterium]|nr:hypothetical protein [Myxococcales bacterium]
MTELTAFEASLARRSRRAAFVSLGGFVIVLLALLAGVLEIQKLEERRQGLQSEIGGLTQERDKLSGEVESLKDTQDSVARKLAANDLVTAREVLVTQKRLPADGRPAGGAERPAPPAETVPVPPAQVIPLSPAEAVRALPASSRATAPGRVFVQIRSREQWAQYESCTRALRSAGFAVPKPELIADRGPARDELRYFHDADAEQARRIAGVVRSVLGREPVTVAIRGYDLVPPRQFELWLAPAQ